MRDYEISVGHRLRSSFGRGQARMSSGGITMALSAVTVVVAMVAVAILARESADSHRRAQVLAEQIRASAQELSALKWQANSEVLARTADLSAGGALVRAGDRIIVQLSSEVAAFQRQEPSPYARRLLGDVQQVYVSGLQQLALARGPKPLSPATLMAMQARFQPRLDQMDGDARRAAEHDQALASGALVRSLLSSIGSLLLGVLALGALGLRLSRLRRSAVLAEEIRAVERRSEQRIRALVEHSSDVVIVLGRDLRVRWQAASVHALLGLEPDSLMGAPVLSIVHPDDRTLFKDFLQVRLHSAAPERLRARLCHTDGRSCYVETVAENRFADPAVEGLVLNMRDVSERKEFEDELRRQAFHDALTGLANRALFEDRLRHALAGSLRTSRVLAVLFMDVDDFKTINDSLGHRAGDALLTGVATRIESVIRPIDTAARLGGDEFAVLLDTVDNEEEAYRIADRILRALTGAFMLDGRKLTVTASIGVAFSDGLLNTEDLMRNADMAMYAAKEHGKDSVKAFESTMHRRALTRLDLRAELQRALTNREFELDYQPIVALPGGNPVGAEALVRWQHPARGRLAPEQFIAAAEESGLIVSLGRWILEQACEQARTWQQALQEGQRAYVSVNVSIRQLREADFPQTVAQALARNELDHDSLVLEITESMLADDPDVIIDQLQQLKGLGLRIAIDDFGTGYSALSQLQQLPIDILKIDKSFIDRLGSEGDSANLVQGIINLGDSLRLDVIAEGIEQHEQAVRLKSMRSHLGQGFLFSPPIPPEALLVCLQSAKERGNPLDGAQTGGRPVTRSHPAGGSIIERSS